MLEVFTAGGLSVDNIVAADGTVQRKVMGGNAVYSAAGARLWLDDVGILGLVPRNYPAGWLERLRAARIRTEGILVVGEPLDFSEWFFYRDDGSRIDQLHAAPDAFAAFGLSGPRISLDDAARFAGHLKDAPAPGRGFDAFRRDHPVSIEQLPPSYGGARGAHLAANRPDALRRMASALMARSVLVTLDPGSNASRLAAERATLGLPALDVFLPSERELERLTAPGTTQQRLCNLVASGVPATVVKLGARGSMVASAGLAAPVVIAPFPVKALDPTGAGDAYCGGFLAGFVRTRDILFSACLGTVSASFAVQAFGPFHLMQATRASAHERLACLIDRLPTPLAANIKAAVPDFARVFP
jgi:sugar/nucleoside kinase (ribokinase family)